MSRHYSKILIELPDDTSDPPYAVLSIDCQQCGMSEVRIHLKHLGTVSRILNQTADALLDDGYTESMMSAHAFMPSTPDNKAKVRAFLDAKFPEWLAERKRARGGN